MDQARHIVDEHAPSIATSKSSVLRICMVSTSRVDDHKAYSGTVHQLHQALVRSDARVDALGRLQHRRLLMNRAWGRVKRIFLGSGAYQVERTYSMARNMAEQIKSHLSRHPADVVFSNSSIPLSLLDIDVPMVFFTDATFKGLRSLYPELRNYPARSLREGEELERLAIQRASRSVFASDWAARSAVEDYGADPAKVRVLPRGGDLGLLMEQNDVERMIAARGRDQCELLLVGVSWQRKGGDLAAEVLRQLNASGLKTRLTTVGCAPPPNMDRSNMEIHRFMDKRRGADLLKLKALFARSHFLLVPSMAECFGIVYAEASSMALPSLARDTGGVKSAVHNDRNGYALSKEASAEAYAAIIERLWHDRDAYADLCRSAFKEFRERLNWTQVGRQLSTILREAANET